MARRASKRATNVTIDADLLKQARELNINLSATLEQALAELVRHRRREHWLADNRAAITTYNQHVAEHGVFSDRLRRF